MNTSKRDSKSNEDQQGDGFDLIEYPCDYLFKAMCKASDGVETALQKVVVSAISEQALIEIRSSYSRTKKFQSVSMTVRLETRQQLDLIYQKIAASEHVVMTL